jgi:hypothetical protein
MIGLSLGVEVRVCLVVIKGSLIRNLLSLSSLPFGPQIQSVLPLLTLPTAEGLR